MLTMVHSNLARLENGTFFVDRKFHSGMQAYLRLLNVPLLTVHPELPKSRDTAIMDLVALPAASLGYSVLTYRTDKHGRPLSSERARIREATRKSRLVYGGTVEGLWLSRTLGVPHVPVLEYNLRTTIAFATSSTTDIIRRTWRKARALDSYVRETIPVMRNATMLHCNGYPIFEESARFSRDRFLFLDSRMGTDLVISEASMERRLRERARRKPRLLFSGRYMPVKGALDAVLAAVECHRMGLDFEMHFFGQGSQRNEMADTVARHGLGGKVVIHDSVPYPVLVEKARTFDLFVCCHVQDDPACTYLESLGCGLPVVGYGNAMWRSMCAESGAGIVTPLGSPHGIAEAVVSLLPDSSRLNALSRQARAFALEHTFEREFARRADSILALYSEYHDPSAVDADSRVSRNHPGATPHAALHWHRGKHEGP